MPTPPPPFPSIPLYQDLGLPPAQFARSRKVGQHYVEKLQEWVLLAGEDAPVPTGCTLVVYRLSELERLRGASVETLQEVHEVKRFLGGRLIEPAPPEPGLRRGAEATFWEEKAQAAAPLPETPFLQALYDHVQGLGFPTLQVRWLTLHGERGWRTFCAAPWASLELQEVAWSLLLDPSEANQERDWIRAQLQADAAAGVPPGQQPLPVDLDQVNRLLYERQESRELFG